MWAEQQQSRAEQSRAGEQGGAVAVAAVAEQERRAGGAAAVAEQESRKVNRAKLQSCRAKQSRPAPPHTPHTHTHTCHTASSPAPPPSHTHLSHCFLACLPCWRGTHAPPAPGLWLWLWGERVERRLARPTCAVAAKTAGQGPPGCLHAQHSTAGQVPATAKPVGCYSQDG